MELYRDVNCPVQSLRGSSTKRFQQNYQNFVGSYRKFWGLVGSCNKILYDAFKGVLSHKRPIMN